MQFGTNTIALTLTEKTTISNPKYLFEFENNQSHSKVYCISNDLSTYKERYNEFNIVVKLSGENALNGEIKLNLGDEYTYRVYAQASSTNLNPSLATELVEIGYMTYEKTMTERVEYQTTDSERKVYE